MKRIYDALIREHIAANRQMAMISGPRQVGKTTSSRDGAGEHRYYSWDRQSDRMLITKGPDAVAKDLAIDVLRAEPLRVVFDEIHKYSSWRTFLKGFFDVYGEKTRAIVTGSARLGFFRRGGDSLMGRYFLYRMHPLSIAEILRPTMGTEVIRPPSRIDSEAFDSLVRYGGYPEPFLRANARFYNRWSRLRNELLFREDLRDLTRIQEAGQVEVLGQLLSAQVGQLVNYSSLSRNANISVDTARRWTATLQTLFHCFTIKPWSQNVPKTLRKQPKVYLWDWSIVDKEGAKRENFVASHLLKAVHWWTDIGLGVFDLYYLRDKSKREVDFLVSRDGRPWFLLEVKSSDRGRTNPSLAYFQRLTKADHAFQIAFDAEYVEADCFSEHMPIIVPARTFLSQLV